MSCSSFLRNVLLFHEKYPSNWDKRLSGGCDICLAAYKRKWRAFSGQKPTADDEVWVEDAQGGLVGALLIVDCRWDDEAERDARDALQHDEDDDQHQGAFIRHLRSQRREQDRVGWVIKDNMLRQKRVESFPSCLPHASTSIQISRFEKRASRFYVPPCRKSVWITQELQMADPFFLSVESMKIEYCKALWRETEIRSRGAGINGAAEKLRGRNSLMFCTHLEPKVQQ